MTDHDEFDTGDLDEADDLRLGDEALETGESALNPLTSGRRQRGDRSASNPGYDLVAVTSRSGFDESYHFGAVVGLGPDGGIEYAIGDPEMPIFGRSSNKPMQAVAMVRAGLQLPDELLALVCASHSGCPEHLAGVARILAGAGLREQALANTKSWPLDDDAAHAAIRAGGQRSALQMNCSGKHAGMLATCVLNGWLTDESYLDRGHPLQARIDEAIAELTVRELSIVGIDGCGAPAHVVPLVGLAQAFRSIAIAPDGDSAEHVVYRAMTSHPNMVGGPGRDVTEFMRQIPGLVAKDGAEGVFAAALPDGRAVALKIADGGDRARPPVLAAALQALGVDVSAAESAWRIPMYGHGREVGDVRAVR